MNQKNRILEMGKRTIYTAEFEVKVAFATLLWGKSYNNQYVAVRVSKWKLQVYEGVYQLKKRTARR